MAERCAVVVLDGVRIVGTGGEVALQPLHRRLVSVLVAYGDRPCPTEALIEQLWPGVDVARGRNRLKVAVGGVRRATAASETEALLLSGQGWYRLDSSKCDVDAWAFESAVRKAAALVTTNAQESLSLLEQSLASFPTGAVPFADTRLDTDIVGSESRRLIAVRTAAVTDFIELAINDSSVGLEESDIADALTHDPYNERLNAAHALVVYRSGRQAEALAIIRDARSMVGDATGLGSHPIVDDLERRMLASDPGLMPDAATDFDLPKSGWRHYATPFIGRRAEVEWVKKRLGAPGVASVVGPGGAGKTRLVYEAVSASGVAANMVDLSLIPAASDPVPVTLAALDLSASRAVAEDVLIRFLAQQPRVLVFDNCEHVVDGVASLVDRLSSVDGLTVLCTSRVALGVPDEVVLSIRGFDPAVAGESGEAVALFEERAQRAGYHGLDTTSGELARICNACDGLPLALELAASWTPHLSLDEILEGLLEGGVRGPDGRRGGSGRHDSMLNAIEWSYSLLNDRDQAVLRRCGLLAPGFTRELLSLVSVDIPERSLVSSMVKLSAHSLLETLGSSHPRRYGLLETVRAFGRRAANREDIGLMAPALSDWARTLMSDAGPRTETDASARLFESLDEEFPNLLNACRIAQKEGDGSLVYHLVDRLQNYIIAREHLAPDVLTLLAEVEAEPMDVDIRTRSRGLLGAGVAAFHAGLNADAQRYLEAAAELADAAGDSRQLANCKKELGRVHVRNQDFKAARSLFREATRLSRDEGDPLRVARELSEQAGAELPEEQVACLEEAWGIVDLSGKQMLRAYVAAQRAWMFVGLGQPEDGIEAAVDCREEYARHGNLSAVAEMYWAEADCMGLLGLGDRRRALLELATEASDQSGDRAAAVISRVRCASVIAEHELDLLDEAEQRAGGSPPLEWRVRIQRAESAERRGDLSEAVTHYATARSQLSVVSSGVRRAVLAVGMLRAGSGRSVHLAEAASALGSMVQEPFMLDGFAFPELGSLAKRRELVTVVASALGEAAPSATSGLQGAHDVRDVAVRLARLGGSPR